MKFNKKLAVAVSGAVLLMAGQFALADSTTDIVDALVSKGVLTEEEGKLISKGAKSKSEADAKANKARVKVSDVIDNAELYGDVRARYERRDGAASNEAKQYETNRSRYKFTLGVQTKAGDAYSDIAFAASSKGSSDNVTLGDTVPGAGTGMSPKTSGAVYLKRVMLGYNVTPWLAVEAGKMANPLYKVNSMVWDSDIVTEGLQEKLKYTWGSTELFGSLGQYIYANNYTSTNEVTTKNPSMLFTFQGGLKQPLIENTASAKGAISLYHYATNLYGSKAYSPLLSGSTRGKAAVAPTFNNDGSLKDAGTDAVVGTTTYSAAVNDLNILDIPVQVDYMVTSNIGVRAYGEYANNLNGSDRYDRACALTASVCGLGDDHQAWTVGMVVGSAKDLKSFEGNKLKAGDWQANLWYQDVGAYALDTNTVDSDIFDSRVNMKGTALKGQYNVADNFYLNFTGAWGTLKNKALGAAGSGGDISANLSNVHLYQFDATYKF